jgi:hypothetical protein
MIRYIVWADIIKSPHDGKPCRVPAAEVARLFGVDPGECVFIDNYLLDCYKLDGIDRTNTVHLRPQANGNYDLPGLKR